MPSQGIPPLPRLSSNVNQRACGGRKKVQLEFLDGKALNSVTKSSIQLSPYDSKIYLHIYDYRHSHLTSTKQKVLRTTKTKQTFSIAIESYTRHLQNVQRQRRISPHRGNRSNSLQNPIIHLTIPPHKSNLQLDNPVGTRIPGKRRNDNNNNNHPTKRRDSKSTQNAQTAPHCDSRFWHGLR